MTAKNKKITLNYILKKNVRVIRCTFTKLDIPQTGKFLTKTPQSVFVARWSLK